MTSEKWERAKQLYQAALKCPRDERPQFLAENCGDDEELLREVSSLLECSDDADSFLEKPAIGEVAEEIVASKSLAGQKILHYNIIRLLGAGGMGEVYLAEDTRLKRQIALKILPATFGEDKTSVRRFEREACAASALNHPNILTVHEFGEHDGMNFIASEYVKGQTLRERLVDGSPLTLSETLDIARQVAAALRAAHTSGIIHRDIKPENVMIRDDAIVKVLDFGLAKPTAQRPGAAGDERETIFQTTSGLIMGTAAYMSPEQARGREIDARTDIWSFGVMLYEMLAGEPPFKGETTSDTIASILTREPEPIDRDLPAGLDEILQKALEKEADQRYQTIEDLILDLETIGPDQSRPPVRLTSKNLKTAVTMRPVPADKSRSWWRILIAAGGLLVVLAGAAAVWKFYPRDPERPYANLLASLRVTQLIAWNAEAGESNSGPQISPNGTMIAYSIIKNGKRNIWTKQIPDGKENRLSDGQGDRDPVWSPNSQRIAFISNRDDQIAIWEMPFSGGELTFVKALKNAETHLLKWSKSGKKIYYYEFQPNIGLNVFALDMDSKETVRLTDFSSEGAQYFSISPDEDRIAYSAGPNNRLHIFVRPIGDGPPVQVTNEESSDHHPFWLPDGKRIIYSSQRSGIFQTCIAYLDEKRTEQINIGSSDTLIVDVSADGSRILFGQSREESDLWKIGVDDKVETQITFDTGLELWPAASADGKSIVFQSTSEAKHLLEGSIRVRSVADTQQQTTVASNGFSPVFSPDGRKVAFLRDANSLRDLWIVDRNGAGERQLTTGGVGFSGFSLMPYNLPVRDFGWSPDSGSLVYCAKKDGVWNVFLVAVDGAAPQDISANSDETISFSSPVFSPDGKYIAYTSAAKASSGGRKGTDLHLWNGEGPAVLYSSASNFKLIGWSGTDLIIAIPEDKPDAQPLTVQLVRIPTGGGGPGPVPIASITAAYFMNIHLSPKGQIALATREDGRDNIRIISVPGGKNTRITANTDPISYIAGMAWSPDGKALYFSKQKQVNIISMYDNFK